MSQKARHDLMFLCQLALGLVFLYPAYIKLGHTWIVFAQNIEAYKLVPEWAVIVLAMWLPWIELVLGLLLVAGVAKRAVRPSAMFLLLAFFLMMLNAYLHGQQIDCGCGFSPDEKIGPGTLIRDGSFVALAIFLSVSAYWPAQRRLE